MAFAEVGEGDVAKLLENKDAKNTQRVVKRSSSLFQKFIGNDVDIALLSKAEINEKLRLFFVSIRCQNGELVKKSTLTNLRYGLSKFLKEQLEIDINVDPEFTSTKEVFKAVSTDLKKKGKRATEHKPVISQEDLLKLYDTNNENVVFNTSCPAGLQRKVWFDIMFYLCRRGRENLRQMSKSTFAVACGANGVEYVYQVLDEADKNHQ